MVNNKGIGALRTTFLLGVVCLVVLLLAINIFNDNKSIIPISYNQTEDDTSINSNINSYMDGNNLIIKYTTDNKNVWIDGLPTDKYSIKNNKVIIYNYNKENFNLHIGDNSDIYEFGENKVEKIKDKTFIEDIRTKDIIKVPDIGLDGKEKYKTFNAGQKSLLIEDQNNNTIIEMKLLSDYIVNGLVASNDTNVAEIQLINWEDTNTVFDIIDYYDISNGYNKINKNMRLKYEIENNNCLSGSICTEWVPFTSLNELPYKNIKISLWTNTLPGEYIEWVPTVQGFPVYEYAAWNITTAVYNGESFLINAAIPGISFDKNGTLMFLIDIGAAGNSSIRYWNLTSPWNISTAVYGGYKSLLTEDDKPWGLFIDDTGKRLYTSGQQYDSIYEYSMSTAWDIGTLSYIRSKTDVTGANDLPTGMYMSSNGTMAYVFDDVDTIHQFVLSDAWNISSAANVTTALYNAVDDGMDNMYFREGGNEMYLIGSIGDRVYRFNLSNIWNVSTSTNTGEYFTFGSQDNHPNAVYFNPIGTKMYMIGGQYGRVFEYDLPIKPVVSITFPVNKTLYGNTQTYFNWTLTNYTTMDNCKYSLNGGINTTISCHTTPHSDSITSIEGNNNLILTATDNETRFGVYQINFTVDTTGPILNVTYPFGSIVNQTIPHTLYFNWTISDAISNLSSCWYNYNNTNTSVVCGNKNTTFVTDLTGQRNLTFYANDTLNNIANYTKYWNYNFLERSRTFDSNSYETTNNSYILNVSSDGLEYTSAEFWYNKTMYTATKIGSSTEMIFTTILSHPWGELGNHSFYWTIDYGGNIFNTTESWQNIEQLQFGICNTTLTKPYINFTFKDEETNDFINSSISIYDWYYFIGDGSQNKTFDYINTTEQESYSFCSNIDDITLHNNASVVYKRTGYAQRNYAQTVDLTNSTLFTTLYLLSTTNGQYVSFQIQDQLSNSLVGVKIVVEREQEGAWTIINTDLTDSSGVVTFFLNTNYNHRITLSKQGYTTMTTTIKPSQTLYTITMGGGTSYTTNSMFNGIRFNTYPKSGTILQPNTTHTFGFNVSSSIGDLVSCKLEITNSSFNTVGSITGCNAWGGNISVALSTGDNKKLFGNYYLDMGSGYQLLKSNDVWMVELTNISSSGGYVWELMTKFGNYSGFGDYDSNKGEFNRITFFFILLVLGLGMFTYFTGIELTNPGLTLGVLSLIIIMFSYTGLFTTDGIIRNGWISKYYIAMMTSMLTGGFILNWWRRNTT